MTRISDLSIRVRLLAGFGVVSAVFLSAIGLNLVLAGAADGAWRDTVRIERAVAGANQQLEGIAVQMRAQARAAATLDARHFAAFEEGVETADRGSAAVAELGDAEITEISASANAVDEDHDRAVRAQLVPAVRRGDRAAALAALAHADRNVDAVQAAVVRIHDRTDLLFAEAVSRASAASSRAHAAGLVAAVLGGLVALGLALLIARSVLVPLRTLERRLRDISEGDGDLTQRVHAGRGDELGAVGRAFNRFADQVQAIVRAVGAAAREQGTTAEALAAASGQTGRAIAQIAATVEGVARGAGAQAESVQGVSAAVIRLKEQSARVADSGSRAAAAAAAGDEAARHGGEVVIRADAAMKGVERRVGEAADAVGGLGDKSEAIGQIVGTITEIAGQTNLLALNAAIEAARAGEEGRGFAVVADEVRKLAEDAHRSAASITTLISDIRTETGRAVEAMAAGREEVAAGAAVVGTAGQAFEAIRCEVGRLSAEVAEVVGAAGELDTVAAEVEAGVGAVAAVSQENAAAAQEVAASSEETSASGQQVAATSRHMADAARELAALVGRFRT